MCVHEYAMCVVCVCVRARVCTCVCACACVCICVCVGEKRTAYREGLEVFAGENVLSENRVEIVRFVAHLRDAGADLTRQRVLHAKREIQAIECRQSEC